MTIAAMLDRARARLPRRLTVSLRGMMALVALMALAFAFETQVKPRWRNFASRATSHEQLAAMDSSEAADDEKFAAAEDDLADHPERITADELRRMANSWRRLPPGTRLDYDRLRKQRVQGLREGAAYSRLRAAKVRARAADHASQARELRERWW
ncbi:MAG TPA: hypothetical protein VG406_10560 [Isosphaeraceae bacterium]|jgi:hypothetical protein|nr:hypothetical protein [Isosphaeraceae bacterium]